MKKIFFVLLFLCFVKVEAKEILISFDGSGRIDMWNRTIEFAKINGVKFTYFVSAPYYVTESWEKSQPYWAYKEIGETFLNPRKDSDVSTLILRKELTKKAYRDGHEIACHLCGHYDGSKWSYSDWHREFYWFEMAMGGLMKEVDITGGCRAPYLGVNKDYFKVLKDFGYVYDSSVGSKSNPVYVNSGTNIEVVPIIKISVIISERVRSEKNWSVAQKLLPFDCDFIAHVQWKLYPETKYKATDQTREKILLSMKEMEDIYFDSLCDAYLNNPYPLQICLHFEKREGDPYLIAMERFVEWAKDKNPEYLTYKEYARRSKDAISNTRE